MGSEMCIRDSVCTGHSRCIPLVEEDTESEVTVARVFRPRTYPQENACLEFSDDGAGGGLQSAGSSAVYTLLWQ